MAERRETIVARRRLPVRCSITGDKDQEVEETKRKEQGHANENA